MATELRDGGGTGPAKKPVGRVLPRRVCSIEELFFCSTGFIVDTSDRLHG
jgi:hypothetical protein